MKYKFTAIECKQNDYPFFITKLSTEILREICYVSRREDKPLDGFQRSLNNSRAKSIASYLDSARGVIPSALILSAQKNAALVYQAETNEIKFNAVKNSFMVLDGQHRLYGLLLAKNEYEIPVIIFNSLDTKNEVTLFIDINTNQKGVPTTLLLDIKNLSGSESSTEDRQRRLFDELNKKSVMAGQLSPNRSRSGKLTRVAFNQATLDIFENGFFREKSDEIIFNSVRNYLKAAENIFIKSKSTKAKLTSAVYFRAIFSIFHEIIDKSLNQFGDLKISSLENIFRTYFSLRF